MSSEAWAPLDGGSWDATFADEAAMQQIRSDTMMVRLQWLEMRLRQQRLLGGPTVFREAYSLGWSDAVAWLLHQQRRVDDLTGAEVVAELRKGVGSIYWPVFPDDGRVSVTCDRCRRLVVVGVDGQCPECNDDIGED